MQPIRLVVAISLCTTMAPARASTITSNCISPSGRSTYELRLDVQRSSGFIRYRFLGQDVTYVARITSLDRGIVSGAAIFHSARTGETRGGPFNFVFDLGAGTFSDGRVKARCG